MNTKHIKIYIVALLITLLIGGCGHTTNEQYDGKLMFVPVFIQCMILPKNWWRKINLKNIIPKVLSRIVGSHHQKIF